MMDAQILDDVSATATFNSASRSSSISIGCKDTGSVR